ncbi:hypothetical protein THRCLA_10689 [Thraustotheca clavata]|uniref:PH domain-containing protein n=1 Tax=Thraustotheca clavata TaxID=74557 RepID=A0A1V9YIG3_9STRA|nr:hypothetical protein THRCLA_10689 [Thraustotheca clavata]
MDEEGSGLERRPNYDATYMKEGFLQKKGQLLKGWKKRWFVCDGRTLSYYITSKDKKPNAVIPLDSATVQDGGLSETWHSPRIYLTDGTSGTMYCLSAEEKGVASDWLSVLTKAVERIHGLKVKNGLERSKSVGGTSITPFDEEEGRQKPGIQNTLPPAQLSPVRKPASGSFFEKRHATHDPKIPQQPTNIKLENNLSVASELLNCLLFNKTSTQHPIEFQFNGVHDNVRVSTAVHKITGKKYARGSAMIKAIPSVVLRILRDDHKRNEWDVHFPISKHVATYGGSTDLIHLSGGSPMNLFADPIYLHPSPAVPALGCAALGSLFAYDPSSMLLHSAASAVLGGTFASVDWRTLAVPRDLLLIRHIYEATSPHTNSRPSCQNVLDAVGMSVVPSAMVILEMSVVNELKPVPKGVIRGHIGVSGWLIEPLDAESTLITYVTDLNLGGWVPSSTVSRVLLDRMKCLSAIAEFVNQAKVYGPNLGYLEDDDDYEDTPTTAGDEVPTYETSVADARSSVFHPRDYFKLMVQIPTGGVKLTDKEVAKKQNGVLMEVIKSMGTKLLEGKSAVSLSLPVRIFEPRSMLERLVDLYLYAPNYLSKANDATDPLERFKLTMTFAIAGWHHGVGCMKPFNPILGETLQAEFVDSAEVFCEHASHHPPISFVQIVAPKYSISSQSILNGSMQGNCVVQVQQGPVRVSFLDGTVIEFSLPGIRMGGFLWGDRVVDLVGNIIFEDKKNGLSCDLKLDPDSKKGMFASNKLPTDRFRGTIMSFGNEACDVSGSWLEDLRFDDAMYWSLHKDSCEAMVRLPDSKVLPSDSRNRQDLKFLAQGDMEEAQEWKLQLEVLQRSDRSKRKDGRRPNHWTMGTSH